MFNIDEFLRHVHSRSGIQRPNKFLVQIAPPLQLAGVLPVNSFGSPPSINPKLSTVSKRHSRSGFGPRAVNLPGVLTAVQESNRTGYGTVEKMPYRMNYNGVSMVFLADGKMQTTPSLCVGWS